MSQSRAAVRSRASKKKNDTLLPPSTLSRKRQAEQEAETRATVKLRLTRTHDRKLTRSATATESVSPPKSRKNSEKTSAAYARLASRQEPKEVPSLESPLAFHGPGKVSEFAWRAGKYEKASGGAVNHPGSMPPRHTSSSSSMASFTPSPTPGIPIPTTQATSRMLPEHPGQFPGESYPIEYTEPTGASRMMPYRQPYPAMPYYQPQVPIYMMDPRAFSPLAYQQNVQLMGPVNAGWVPYPYPADPRMHLMAPHIYQGNPHLESIPYAGDNKGYRSYNKRSRNQRPNTVVKPADGSQLYVGMHKWDENIGRMVLIYTCKICEKTFSGKSGMQAHIRTHTGERPYKCTHCDSAFAHRTNLRRHLLIHERKRNAPKNRR